jgi:hypothetical protein
MFPFAFNPTVSTYSQITTFSLTFFSEVVSDIVMQVDYFYRILNSKLGSSDLFYFNLHSFRFTLQAIKSSMCIAQVVPSHL